ncbi:hypothetical protein I546_3077 [Mycobacterium kansasii 732]|nr:hypothetical protein I546_3077 [Mycobacterium kansasii 732]
MWPITDVDLDQNYMGLRIILGKVRGFCAASPRLIHRPLNIAPFPRPRRK